VFFWCVCARVKVRLMGTMRYEHTKQFYENEFKYLILQNTFSDMLVKGDQLVKFHYKLFTHWQ